MIEQIVGKMVVDRGLFCTVHPGVFFVYLRQPREQIEPDSMVKTRYRGSAKFGEEAVELRVTKVLVTGKNGKRSWDGDDSSYQVSLSDPELLTRVDTWLDEIQARAKD